MENREHQQEVRAKGKTAETGSGGRKRYLVTLELTVSDREEDLLGEKEAVSMALERFGSVKVISIDSVDKIQCTPVKMRN